LTRTLANKPIGKAGQEARSIAASPVSVHPATVRKPDQGFERPLDNFARSTSSESCDQADTAGIMVCGYVPMIHL
jgi:hypothetical protein